MSEYFDYYSDDDYDDYDHYDSEYRRFPIDFNAESSYRLAKDNIFKRGLKQFGIIEAPKRPSNLSPLTLPQGFEFLQPFMMEFDKKGVWHPGYTLFIGRGNNKIVPKPLYVRLPDHNTMSDAFRNNWIVTEPFPGYPQGITFRHFNEQYYDKNGIVNDLEISSSPLALPNVYPVIWEVSSTKSFVQL